MRQQINKEMVVGKIIFEGSREQKALDVLKEALVDRKMWEEEWAKKDYECEQLREEIKRLRRRKRRG